MQICKHEHSQSSSQDGLQNSQAPSHIANCQASSSHLCIFFEVHNEAGINTHANCKHQKQPFTITQSLPTSQASHHLKIFAKQLHINIKRNPSTTNVSNIAEENRQQVEQIPLWWPAKQKTTKTPLQWPLKQKTAVPLPVVI